MAPGNQRGTDPCLCSFPCESAIIWSYLSAGEEGVGGQKEGEEVDTYFTQTHEDRAIEAD